MRTNEAPYEPPIVIGQAEAAEMVRRYGIDVIRPEARLRAARRTIDSYIQTAEGVMHVPAGGWILLNEHAPEGTRCWSVDPGYFESNYRPLPRDPEGEESPL